jgi:23S rRNA (cytidine1920-2'-O)/16S rRNA (cytidine1409-2'-O)-methyltransferase
MASFKKRLDEKIMELYPDLKSKTYAQSLIMQRKVIVNDQIIDKPGFSVTDKDKIVLNYVAEKYVCRAGYKLEKALQEFNINLKDKIAIDAGLSTGGFTHCMLQHGIQKIYGIDVGHGQVHYKIQQDPRVIVMEKTNLRHVESLPEKIDLVTLDLSFISILKVIPAILKITHPSHELIVLIKPQFEAKRKDIPKGGVIKDPNVHEYVVQYIKTNLELYGYNCKGIIESPITGTSGNKEFLGYFIK